MKREITEEHREKLRANMAKARAARQANDPRLPEAVRLLDKILHGITSVYGDGRLDKRFCTICERTFIAAQANPCVCQDAWRFVAMNDGVRDASECGVAADPAAEEGARGGQGND